jgi:predicted RNase H-like HicB family nuclease
MTQYIVLLHKNGRKGYGASFPDFPGCVSGGTTVEDTLREAAEALALHVDGMLEDGQKIPKPRSVEAIHQAGQDWVDLEDALVATVPLLPASGKAVRVQVTIDERLLARIDAVTKNRSAFLAQAATEILDKGIAKAQSSR